MNEKEVVQILQYYRHDLMNHLQIIQGYLSMGKTDKVETKVRESLEYYNEERKLIHLHASRFILWVIQFNSFHDNIRLTYQIHTDKKFNTIDKQLVEQCKNIIACISETYGKTELFEVNLQINETEDPSLNEVTILIYGECRSVDQFHKNLENMEQNYIVKLSKTSEAIVCKFSIPCNI